MARRSSGGSSSSNRSSGGRSGGSFSSSRSSRSSSSSSSSSRGSTSSRPGSSFPSGTSGGSSRKKAVTSPFRIPVGGFRRPTTAGTGVNAAGCAGCGGCSLFAFGVIVIAILLIVLVASGTFSSCGSNPGNVEITKSTIAREPLPKGSVNETGYYTDELGWINKDSVLINGMKHFYQETGVQPYLYITDTVNGSHSPTADDLADFADSLYDKLFTDEAHCLVVFFEYGDGYMDRYVCGNQAKTVIDDEAADILLDYIDKYYYYDNFADEEFFAKAFSDAADRIMTVTRSPWIPVFIIIGVIALIALLLFWWSNVKRQKNIEAKQTEDILNTPLEKFGDKDIEELTKKYDDDEKT